MPTDEPDHRQLRIEALNAEIKRLTSEHNVAVASGSVLKSRRIGRAMRELRRVREGLQS